MSSNSNISAIGQRWIELSTVDSTNNYALGLIKTNLAEHGTAVFAQEQTAGKGQRGKAWITEPNSNLILSVIVQTEFLPLHQQFVFSAAMALAVQSFFNNYTANETVIKWPNDIYWNDRKAGGILIENIISGSGSWQWAVVGIGLNINQIHFPDWLPNPVSLQQITGKRLNCLELAKELCKYLNHYYRLLQAGAFTEILQQYNNYLYKKGAMVKLKKNNAVFTTTIQGVDQSGNLLTGNTFTNSFSFGEVEWIISTK
ncbi:MULTISPECIES: biotin--[acetyl-CoA-carboxylase] ligase [Hydrotalea]|uniref:biotin--[acetyl-CoA-carboxylase] ligase n=1 Tax=Hydrotalea TaxID=1004300 RepID=UPI001E5AB156|nr:MULTISPECIES: biotin--[acetyl-CoA-carboxylase] ligase [Hydrotalea]